MSLFSTSASLTLSLKVGLVSTFVLTVAMVLKFSVPLVSDLVASDVPVVWKVLLQWLKPPYLYLVINCIIISIVASSKLQHKVAHDAAAASSSSSFVSDKADLSGVDRTGYDHHQVAYSEVSDLASGNVVLSGVVRSVEYRDVYEDVRYSGVAAVYGRKEEEEKNVSDGDTAVEGAAAAAAPQRSDSMEFLERFFEKEKAKEIGKPPVSARFGQRKAVKSSPEGGKALKVSKWKRHDTLESTWKTITEGRSMPLARHLKKSDTWDTHVRQNSPPPPMKKSETFNDRATATTADGGNTGKLRKEPSLSQEELNRRVEAFIKKFNEEMRLQRQRSIEQYNEMIRRRAN